MLTGSERRFISPFYVPRRSLLKQKLLYEVKDLIASTGANAWWGPASAGTTPMNTSVIRWGDPDWSGYAPGVTTLGGAGGGADPRALMGNIVPWDGTLVATNSLPDVTLDNAIWVLDASTRQKWLLDIPVPDDSVFGLWGIADHQGTLTVCERASTLGSSMPLDQVWAWDAQTETWTALSFPTHPNGDSRFSARDLLARGSRLFALVLALPDPDQPLFADEHWRGYGVIEWDGSTWSELGHTVFAPSDARPRSMADDGTYIYWCYAGGLSWVDADNPPDPPLQNEGLYAAGALVNVDDPDDRGGIHRLAWAAQNQKLLIGGFFNQWQDLRVDGNAVIMNDVNSVLTWDPASETFERLGDGLVDDEGDPRIVRSVVEWEGKYVAAGGAAGSSVFNNLDGFAYVWDPSEADPQWRSLGEFAHTRILDLAILPADHRGA